MMMRERNVEMLHRVAQRVLDEDAEGRFDMKNWMAERSCGTTACIAGHACLVDVEDDSGWRVVRITGGDIRDYELLDDQGRGVSIQYRAAELLGLSSIEAEALFHCTGFTAEEAAKALIEIAGGRDVGQLLADMIFSIAYEEPLRAKMLHMEIGYLLREHLNVDTDPILTRIEERGPDVDAVAESS